MWSFIVKGGPIMVPIILCSIFGLAIILEKFYYFKRIGINNARFTEEVFTEIKNNRIQKAVWLCDQNAEAPLAMIFKAGLEKADLPVERLEKVLEHSGNIQVQRMEKRLTALGSIITISPLLGFLGTITGLINAFKSWEIAGANITVSILSQGIHEAMITTAAGLIVAVPFFLCHNYFISRIKYIASELTDYGQQFLDAVSAASIAAGQPKKAGA